MPGSLPNEIGKLGRSNNKLSGSIDRLSGALQDDAAAASRSGAAGARKSMAATARASLRSRLAGGVGRVAGGLGLPTTPAGLAITAGKVGLQAAHGAAQAAQTGGSASAGAVAALNQFAASIPVVGVQAARIEAIADRSQGRIESVFADQARFAGADSIDPATFQASSEQIVAQEREVEKLRDNARNTVNKKLEAEREESVGGAAHALSGKLAQGVMDALGIKILG